MATLTATRSVMTFVGRHGDWARFEAYDEDSGRLRRRVSFLAYEWDDMGCPRVVTLTIEPGDRLNEEAD